MMLTSLHSATYINDMNEYYGYTSTTRKALLSVGTRCMIALTSVRQRCTILLDNKETYGYGASQRFYYTAGVDATTENEEEWHPVSVCRTPRRQEGSLALHLACDQSREADRSLYSEPARRSQQIKAANWWRQFKTLVANQLSIDWTPLDSRSSICYLVSIISCYTKSCKMHGYRHGGREVVA